MSWSLAAAQIKSADVAEKLLAVKQQQLEAAPFDSFDDDVERSIDQGVALAEKVAQELDEDYVTVYLSGHRRRGETDPASFSISVAGATAPAPPEKGSTKT